MIRTSQSPAVPEEAPAASGNGGHPPRPTVASALEVLTKARLVAVGRDFNVAVPPEVTKREQLRRLAESGELRFAELLRSFGRDELKAACRAHGLDDSGRARPALAARLLAARGEDEGEAPAPMFAREAARQTPAEGDVVQVRHRQYLVEHVEPPPAPRHATRVRLVCLDDDNQGRPLEALWELELGARVLQTAEQPLGEVAGLDPPRRFAAYLHALRWSSVTATDARLFQAPFRAGIRLMNHQMTPLKKALELPRANLFIADDVGLGKTIEAGLVLEDRRPVDAAAGHLWFRNRRIQEEPVELTSREPQGRIKESKARLARPHAAKDHVDVLLASNMISVGVDIDRLGLMVVAGQPKTTSEYIQASSRVGRQAERPGLVVTCFNLHKPRDRSHYERFAAYHESFYRFVEATSLTPFSGPALDRGLAGALVALTRLRDPAMTPPAAAMDLGQHRALGEEAVRELAARRGRQPGASGDHDALVTSLEHRGRNLLDAWERLADEAKKAAARRAFSPFDRDKSAGKPILFTPLDEDAREKTSDEAKFSAPTSMRDVEPSVHLWLERRRLGGSG